MSVAFDKVTASGTMTGGTTVAVTPVGTPRGVLVLLAQLNSAADGVTGVTYGGVALTRVPTNGYAADASGEQMSAYAYFLGAGIPTGTQNCVMSFSGSSSRRAFIVTLSAADDTEIEASGKVQGDVANPSTVLSTTAETFVAAVLSSGQNAVGGVTVGSGFTSMGNADIGNFTAHTQRRTANAPAGSVTVNFTATSDDVAMIAVAIKETGGAPPPGFDPRTASMLNVFD